MSGKGPSSQRSTTSRSQTAFKQAPAALGRLQTASKIPAFNPEEVDAARGLVGLSSEKSRAQLEAYLLSLELEEATGALAPASMDMEGGRRRRRFRGGGEVAKKAFSWLWGTISGTLKPVGESLAASDTAAALGKVLEAAKSQPKAMVVAADKAAAAAVSSAIPVVQGLSAAAPIAAFAVGRSYLLSHPSLAVSIADYASRMAITVGDNVGVLGPSWGVFIAEFKSATGIALDAAKNAGTVVSQRPYVALYIAYLLLKQYATHKKTTVKDLLTDTGKKVANAALGAGTAAVGAVGAFGTDFVSVVVAQNDEFEAWLNTRPDVDESIKALGRQVKNELKQKAEAAKATAAAEEEKAEEEIGDESPRAGTGATGGRRRRLTSRHLRTHPRRASGPRRTRRSSSGRRRGYSRRTRG